MVICTRHGIIFNQLLSNAVGLALLLIWLFVDDDMYVSMRSSKAIIYPESGPKVNYHVVDLNSLLDSDAAQAAH